MRASCAPVAPDSSPSERILAAALTFHLVGDGDECQLTVEYAAPSQLASISHARDIVASCLDDETPLRRVIVARDGDVVRTEAE